MNDTITIAGLIFAVGVAIPIYNAIMSNAKDKKVIIDQLHKRISDLHDEKCKDGERISDLEGYLRRMSEEK